MITSHKKSNELSNDLPLEEQLQKLTRYQQCADNFHKINKSSYFIIFWEYGLNYLIHVGQYSFVIIAKNII